MNKRRVTQREIARATGVSQTTVSLILAGDESINVTNATRERVMMTATALGYVPQAAARALAQGKTHVIALVLKDPHAQVFRDPFIPNVIAGITEVASLQGFRLLIERIPADADLSIVNSLLRGQQVDGAILSSIHQHEETLSTLQRDGFPIVLLDTFEPLNFSVVGIDHLGGIRSAVSHLVKLGHQRIGCIPYVPLKQQSILKRFGMYRQVLADAGLDVDMSIVVSGALEPETGAAAMKRILANPHRPTAVFAMNDMMALGALFACAEVGVSVPNEMAIVGYDDMRFAGFTVPALTTVRAPEVELGRASAETLLAKIADEPMLSDSRLLKTELIIRQSSGGRI